MNRQVKFNPEKVNGTAAEIRPKKNENALSTGKGSVVKQVDTIIHKAIDLGASDIHFEPFEKMFRVRYRLDGVLQTGGTLSLHQKDGVISRIKIMAQLDIAEKRRPQDGRISVNRNKGQVDLRVSTLPTDFGEKIVLRILDKESQRLELTDLGFNEQGLGIFREAIHHPYGMILVTGPTGSGKTTTLYAALNELNSPEVNITAIEDPIEYYMEGINQTQVHSDIGLNFSNVLRSILRQDPNIIMVGEIRDRETADIAIRAALTGHLVFSTLHTNDAPSAIARLLDMGIEPFLVASSVRLILAQRLVRKVCPECGSDTVADPVLLRQLELEHFTEPLRKGSGCDFCNNTGYKGRTALIEWMPVSSKLSDKINGGAGTGELKRQAEKEGMKSLREAGVQRIKEGITTPEEVIRETI